jgi:hypothetical protein
VTQAPWKQAEQALPAGIDDAGLAENRQQRRRLRDGLLRGVDRRRQHDLDVVRLLGGRDGRLGRLADDGEDRALDRLRHRAVGRLRALLEGIRQVEAVEALLPPRPRPCPGRSGS